MLLFEVRATAENGNLVGQPMPEAVEECIVVLAGVIEVCLVGQTYRLEAGDSIYFESRDLESIYVVGEAEATVYFGGFSTNLLSWTKTL